MPAISIIELVADSEHSWEDAVSRAVEETARTVRHIQGVEVTNMTAKVEGGRIRSYRANLNLAFAVEPERP